MSNHRSTSSLHFHIDPSGIQDECQDRAPFGILQCPKVRYHVLPISPSSFSRSSGGKSKYSYHGIPYGRALLVVLAIKNKAAAHGKKKNTIENTEPQYGRLRPARANKPGELLPSRMCQTNSAKQHMAIVRRNGRIKNLNAYFRKAGEPSALEIAMAFIMFDPTWRREDRS